MISRFKNNSGFTLIELLIAIALAGLVAGAMYAAYFTQERVHKAQQLVSEMQSNSKAAMTVITKEVRMINAYLGADGIGYWDKLGDKFDHTYQNGFEANNDYQNKGTDVIDIAYADFDVSTPLRENMPKSSSIMKVETTDGFEDGMFVIVSDGSKSNIMEITHVSDNALTLQHNPAQGNINSPASKDWDHGGYNREEGSMIFLVKFVSFRILHDDPDHPSLGVAWQYNPMDSIDDRDYYTFVEDIEDLQVTYILTDGTVMDEPTTQDDYDAVRSIKISVVARTHEPVRGFLGSARPAAGDRSAGSKDNYQRRLLEEEIQIRNLNLRPEEGATTVPST